LKTIGEQRQSDTKIQKRCSEWCFPSGISPAQEFFCNWCQCASLKHLVVPTYPVNRSMSRDVFIFSSSGADLGIVVIGCRKWELSLEGIDEMKSVLLYVAHFNTSTCHDARIWLLYGSFSVIMHLFKIFDCLWYVGNCKEK